MSAIAPPAASPADTQLTRGPWGMLFILAAINCVEVTDALLLAPLADTLQKADGGLGLTKREYSFCAAVYGFAAAVSGFVAALVVDRVCRKRLVLGALLGLTGAMLASGVAWDYPTFFLARLAAGVFGGVTVCGIFTILADTVPNSRRGVALSILRGSFGVAAVIGLPVCVGVLAATGRFGPPFLTVAAATAAVWVVAALALPRMVNRFGGGGNPVAGFVQVFVRPNHLAAFACMGCSGLGAYVVIPFMAQYMQQNCGVPAGLFPFVFLAMGVASVGTGLLAGVLVDRLGRRPVFVVAVGLFVIMTLVITNLPPVGVWVAGAVACGYMATAIGRLVPTDAVVLSAAPPAQVGAFTTVVTSVSLLATSFGPLIAGLIVPNTSEDMPVENYSTCGLVAVGFAAAAVGLSFVVRPQGDRRDVSPPV